MNYILKNSLIFCLSSLAVSLLLDDPLCRHGWYHYGEKCYMFATDTLTWTNAEFKCRVFGGHLAEILDEETNDFIKQQANKLHTKDKNHHYFVGLTDEAKTNSWEWIQSQTTPNFTDWGEYQPDNINGGASEHCVMLYGPDGYRWHDSDCEYPHLFICEEPETNVQIIG